MAIPVPHVRAQQRRGDHPRSKRCVSEHGVGRDRRAQRVRQWLHGGRGPVQEHQRRAVVARAVWRRAVRRPRGRVNCCAAGQLERGLRGFRPWGPWRVEHLLWWRGCAHPRRAPLRALSLARRRQQLATGEPGRARALHHEHTRSGGAEPDAVCAARCAARMFDPVDPNTVYVSFFSRGIWRSRDLGDTWEQIMLLVGSATSTAERAEFDVAALPSARPACMSASAEAGSSRTSAATMQSARPRRARSGRPGSC